MKLYYSPGACSLASHIALREAKVPFELVAVNLPAKTLVDSGNDYYAITKKGYVPALGLDDGSVLTEGAVILQYIADLKPETGLAPKQGTFERVRLQEWLHFIATELQKGAGPLYHPKANEEFKAAIRPRVHARFEVFADALGGRSYLFGEKVTVADAYGYYVLRDRKRLEALAPNTLSILSAYVARIQSRPSVRASLEAEGIKS